MKTKKINFRQLLQEFHYRGIDGLDKENSPELRSEYARTLALDRAQNRNKFNAQKDESKVIYDYTKNDPEYNNIVKDLNDIYHKKEELEKKLRSEYKPKQTDFNSKINKNDLSNNFNFDSLTEKVLNNNDLNNEIQNHPDMKYYNNKIKKLNDKKQEIKDKVKSNNSSNNIPLYFENHRKESEQTDLRRKLNKYENNELSSTPDFDERVFKAKGWSPEQIIHYKKLLNAQAVSYLASKSTKNKNNINPNGLISYDNFGKIKDFGTGTGTVTDYISGERKLYGKNILQNVYKNIPKPDELQNDNSLIDKTPQENKDRYIKIQKKYKHARLPEYDTFFKPFEMNSDINKDTKNSYNENTKKGASPKRNVHIPKPLARKGEVIKLSALGLAGLGGIGLNKYLSSENLNENDFIDNMSNINNSEEDDGLSLGHMLGAAGAIHVGQNIASKRMLNKKQGQKVGDHIFKPDNSTSTNVKSGLKYTVAPEVGMIHNAIQDHIDHLKHNDDPNKIKDIILIKKALKGDFASVINSKHFQNNPELQHFLKDKMKIPVDQMLMDYHTNIKPSIDRNLTKGAQNELIRNILTNPYEQTYKNSSIGDFNSGLAQSLNGKNIRNIKKLNKDSFEKGNKIRNITQYMGAGALSAFEPIAGGLTLSKQILSKKYDPKKNPRIVAAQNLMHQVLIDHPSKKAYYQNAKADNLNDSEYKGSSHLMNNILKYGGNVLAGEFSDLTGKMTHIAKNDNLHYLDKAQEKNNVELRKNMFRTGVFRNANFEKDLQKSKEYMNSDIVYDDDKRQKDYPFKDKNNNIKQNDELNQKEKDSMFKRYDEKTINRKSRKALDELEKQAKEINDRTKKQFEGVRREEARYNKINKLKFKRNVNQLLFGNKK